MYAIHVRPASGPQAPDPAPITAHDIAVALFDASERIACATTPDQLTRAIAADTALWLALASAAREGLLSDVPPALVPRLLRVADTITCRTLTLRPLECGGTLAMRLVRINDLACRALAPPTRRRGRPAPPAGLNLN
ncbi:hypothetical protein [Caenispirillum bisanense]|uniref:hypothetical protein n=1 Tax=Caenispirillum bisanense TaxID=414052 RepID=UPI0031DDF1FE